MTVNTVTDRSFSSDGRFIGVRGFLVLVLAYMALGILGMISLSILSVGAEWDNISTGIGDNAGALFIIVPPILVAAYGVLAFVLMLRRRHSAPRHASIWLVVLLVVNQVYANFGKSSVSASDLVAPLITAAIVVACLVYLRRSRRVAATYDAERPEAARPA